jgi:hypothetical protein
LISCVGQESQRIRHILASQNQSAITVHSVPHEIWSKIFEFCLPDEQFISWKLLQAPFSFQLVCKAWRDIVLSTPQLWSSVVLQLLPTTIRAWKTQIDLFITLSGALPLSVELQWYPPSGTLDLFEQVDQIERLLVISGYRWQNVSLFLPPRCVAKILESQLPSLEFLSVHGFSPNERPTFAPKLNRLQLDMRSDPRKWDLGRGWFQMKELDFHFILVVEDILRILGMCPRLQCARFRVGSMTIPPSQKYALILDHLESLVMRIDSQSDTFVCFASCLNRKLTRGSANRELTNPNTSARLLEHLSLPSLKSLEISRSCYSSRGNSHHLWMKAVIEDLVRRSDCPLQSLILKGLSVLNVDAIEFIDAVPTLLYLDISNDGQDSLSHAIRDVLNERCRRFFRGSNTCYITREPPLGWQESDDITIGNLGSS